MCALFDLDGVIVDTANLGQYVWPNDFVGDTYEEEVDFLKTWLTTRLTWMDDNMHFHMKKKNVTVFSIALIVFFFISFFLSKIFFSDYDKLQAQLHSITAEVEKIKNFTPLEPGEKFFSEQVLSNKKKDRFHLEKYFLPFRPYYKSGLKVYYLTQQ